jgi:hypothetical protein
MSTTGRWLSRHCEIWEIVDASDSPAHSAIVHQQAQSPMTGQRKRMRSPS